MKKQLLLLALLTFIINSCSWESDDHFDKVEEFRPILAQNDSLVSVINRHELMTEDINQAISLVYDEETINKLKVQLTIITQEKAEANEILNTLNIFGRYPKLKSGIEYYNEIIKKISTNTYSINKLILLYSQNYNPDIANEILELKLKNKALEEERSKAKAKLNGDLIRGY